MANSTKLPKDLEKRLGIGKEDIVLKGNYNIYKKDSYGCSDFGWEPIHSNIEILAISRFSGILRFIDEDNSVITLSNGTYITREVEEHISLKKIRKEREQAGKLLKSRILSRLGDDSNKHMSLYGLHRKQWQPLASLFLGDPVSLGPFSTFIKRKTNLLSQQEISNRLLSGGLADSKEEASKFTEYLLGPGLYYDSPQYRFEKCETPGGEVKYRFSIYNSMEL